MAHRCADGLAVLAEKCDWTMVTKNDHRDWYLVTNEWSQPR